MKVHRYWNETWQPEYAEGPTPKSSFGDPDEADVPEGLWLRLQRAEQELEDVRELIESIFGPPP